MCVNLYGRIAQNYDKSPIYFGAEFCVNFDANDGAKMGVLSGCELLLKMAIFRLFEFLNIFMIKTILEGVVIVCNHKLAYRL